MTDDGLQTISDSFQADNWRITAGLNTHGSEPIPEGVLARTDWVEASVTGVVNRNKRLYERELWENVLNEDRVQAKIEDANGLLGELDHPEYFEPKAKKAGIRTFDMRLNEEGNMELRFDILDTPAPGTGRVTYALVQAGLNLGVSSRGRGKLEKVKKNGEVYERVNPERYQFATWDAVSGPGFATARVNKDQMAVQEAFECIGESCDPEAVETAQRIYEDVTGGMHRPGSCSVSETNRQSDALSDDQVDPNKPLEEDSTVRESNGSQSVTEGTELGDINEENISVDQVRQLKTTVDSLSDRLTEVEERNEELESTIDEKDEKIARLQGEEAQQQVEDLEEQVATLQEKLDLATEALDEYEQKEETIQNLKEANITQEEKLALAYETIERQDEALELASETIEEFKDHYLTACDVIEQWQYEDQESELREHMEQRCKQTGVDPNQITHIVESATSKQNFDQMLGDILEAQGRERPEDFEQIQESAGQGDGEGQEDESIQEGAQRYQSGAPSGGRTPGLDDVDEQVNEEDLEGESVNESSGQGPDKDLLKERINRVGSGK